MHHFRPPSMNPEVTAVLWAVSLGAYIYFGLKAIGASGAFSVVIAMVSAAGIWVLVRARGDSA